MNNVTLKTDGNILTITVDLSKRNGLSSTGKSQVIASTKGNAELPGHPGVKIGLNVYVKA